MLPAEGLTHPKPGAQDREAAHHHNPDTRFRNSTHRRHHEHLEPRATAGIVAAVRESLKVAQFNAIGGADSGDTQVGLRLDLIECAGLEVGVSRLGF